jgi:DNA-3-methyladenine glycosylase
VRTSGIIVEVEAYIGESDPACHAAPGPTKRNAPLYGPPGYAYVYLNYGIHPLVNVVTESRGSPAAVLIRALAPLEGVEVMRRRRSRRMKGRTRTVSRPAVHDLCRGPGNLTMAMGITLAQNKEDLCGARLYIEDRGLPHAHEIAWGPRIGIRVGIERAWRAYLQAHPSVSG